MKTVLFAAATLAVPALAQPARAPRPPRPTPISIAMTDNGYVPRQIVLRAGAPYVLRLSNRSSKGHNLSQGAFFQNARVDASDSGWTRDGRISLRPGERAVVHFLAPETRPGGTYQFSSTVLGDSAKSYTGVFVIR